MSAWPDSRPRASAPRPGCSGPAGRARRAGRWVWLFLNGIIDLFLAGIIIWLLPFAAVWALGLIIGIDFIFGGVGLIGMALAAREA